jgi:hypothetical protein
MLDSGDTVRHQELGTGRILRREGSRFKVRFGSLAFPVLLSARELTPYHTAQAKPVPARHEDPDKAPRSDLPAIPSAGWAREAPLDTPRGWGRRVLEACRYGILEGGHVLELTVGRETELAAFEKSLTAVDQRGSAWGVIGDYGSGKSHLLALLAETARSKGFLTSHITIDPLELKPCNPKRLYRSLVTQLRYPDRSHSGEGLAPLLDLATEDEAWKSVAQILVSLAGEGHRYLSSILLLWRQQRTTLKEDFVEWARTGLAWIEAQDDVSTVYIKDMVRRNESLRDLFPALPDHRTRSHTFTYILTGISTLARVLGYKGLVVLLDEAEYHERLRGEDRGFSDDFFARLLYAGLNPRTGLLADYETSAYRGGGVTTRREPSIFRHPSGLVPIIAATPGTGIAGRIQRFLGLDQIFEVQPLRSADVHHLIARLADLYWQAYAESANGSWPKEVTRPRYDEAVGSIQQIARGWLRETPENVVRPIIRATVHVLDLLRHRRIDPRSAGDGWRRADGFGDF